MTLPVHNSLLSLYVNPSPASPYSFITCICLLSPVEELSSNGIRLHTGFLLPSLDGSSILRPPPLASLAGGRNHPSGLPGARDRLRYPSQMLWVGLGGMGPSASGNTAPSPGPGTGGMNEEEGDAAPLLTCMRSPRAGRCDIGGYGVTVRSALTKASPFPSSPPAAPQG